MGQKPEEIVYVRQIDLRPGALKKFRDAQKKAAEEKARRDAKKKSGASTPPSGAPPRGSSKGRGNGG